MNTIDNNRQPPCQGCEYAQCWNMQSCLKELEIIDDNHPAAKILERWRQKEIDLKIETPD